MTSFHYVLTNRSEMRLDFEIFALDHPSLFTLKFPSFPHCPLRKRHSCRRISPYQDTLTFLPPECRLLNALSFIRSPLIAQTRIWDYHPSPFDMSWNNCPQQRHPQPTQYNDHTEREQLLHLSPRKHHNNCAGLEAKFFSKLQIKRDLLLALFPTTTVHIFVFWHVCCFVIRAILWWWHWRLQERERLVKEGEANKNTNTA